MSEYQVLARKYRPQSFRDVVAQAPIVATLKNAILKERIAHAYLFCGCRGTGKTTLARLFAKALNCAHLSAEMEPCGSCPSCKEITLGHAIDVLEIDGASHRGIEDVRQINETIGFSPLGGRYKIYLIDEVHMLTKEAFNALLKTLEEPPSHVKFFFCTTEPHKIPSTILSRCQRFNLRRIPQEKMVAKLSQIAAEAGVIVEPEALHTLAELSEGSLRDALSLFDQLIAFGSGPISSQTVAEALGLPSQEMLFTLGPAGVSQDLTIPFKMAAEIFASGKNISYFLEELIAHFRTLLLLKNGVAQNLRDQKKYQEAAGLYRTEQLVQILELLSEGQQTIKSSPSERTALEMLLLRVVRTHQQLSLEGLVQRLFSLEQKITKTAAFSPSSSISEDPIPSAEELPLKKAAPAKPAPTALPPPRIENRTPPKNQSATPAKEPPAKPTPSVQAPAAPLSVQEQSRFDTVMRFAAKELNGSLKKE